MAKQIVVKQKPDEEVPTEVLADSIQAIAVGVRKLRGGRLNDRALFLLIRDAAGSYGPKRRLKSQLSLRDIEAVFDGINSLESTFLRKRQSAGA